jgi:hypothetical protein
MSLKSTCNRRSSLAACALQTNQCASPPPRDSASLLAKQTLLVTALLAPALLSFWIIVYGMRVIIGLSGLTLVVEEISGNQALKIITICYWNIRSETLFAWAFHGNFALVLYERLCKRVGARNARS